MYTNELSENKKLFYLHSKLLLLFDISNSMKLGNPKRDKEKLLKMNKRCFKNHHTDIRDGNAYSKDEKNEVDAQRLTDGDRITGKTSIIPYDCHVDEVDAVAHPGQGYPGFPREDGVDWTTHSFDTGKNDPGETD